MSFISIIFLFLSLFIYCQSLTYDELGDINFQCIKEFDYEISRLSKNDADKVSELSFVFVMYRHGIRHPDLDINSYFQSRNITYQCNEKQLFGSNIRSGYTDYNSRGNYRHSNRDESEQSKYILEFDHVNNEQVYTNTNCQLTQIADNTPDEMIETGKIVGNRYFESFSNRNHNKQRGNKKTNKKVNKKQPTDQFKSKFQSPKYITSKAINVNRVISSHIYFMEGLLFNGKYNINDNILISEHHDLDTDPFRTDSSASILCQINGEFNEWRDRYNVASNTATIRNEFANSKENIALINKFESEGGIWIGPFTTSDIPFSYCADVDIPISIETFLEIVNFGKIYFNLFDDEKFELNRCYFHQIMRPAYGRIKQALLDAIEDGKNGKKMYVIGSQGFGITAFLFGLDLFDESRFPKQGEIITWEVYKGVNSDSGSENDYNWDDYYFRWTRDGEFIEYPPCRDIYDVDGSELCPLSVFMNNEFGFIDAVNVQDFRNVSVNAVSHCWCGLCDNV